MISLNTLYDVTTPLLGLSSIALTVKMFLAENLTTPTLTDVSPMGIIMSLVGAFLLGLMRITNSIKSVEESNAKILTAHTELLKLLADDSKKQDLILENQKALVENQKALLEIPKSGEVWCEGARLCMSKHPNNPYFNLEKALKYLDFAIQFTPQYGDSFLETIRVCELMK